MTKQKVRGSAMLLLTAMIWGAAFVAQSAGLDHVGPFTFNALRMTLGGAVLLPFIALRGGLRGRWPWLGGIACGTALFAASSLQQIGLLYTTAGKAGFITTLYVVLVPLVRLFSGKKPRALLWVSVALAAVGLYLLCITEDFTLGRGDLLVALCAACFTVHILLIDRFSPHADGVRLSCIQFFTAGALALAGTVLLEAPTAAACAAAAVPVLYAGVMSCGVAYTLQVVAQKDTDPTVASLILCLESVFAVLFAWLLLGELLTAREALGCVLMFVAIVLAQFV